MLTIMLYVLSIWLSEPIYMTCMFVGITKLIYCILMFVEMYLTVVYVQIRYHVPYDMNNG